jgi:pimeloyl-ACP methyl ester carboxylesterase
MNKACIQLRGTHLVPHAGHSIVEEQPDATNQLLIDFLNTVARG